MLKESMNMLRTLVYVLLMLVIAGFTAQAQLKSDQEASPSASQSMFRPAQSIGSFLGLMNPNNFMMRHSLSFSYLSTGGMGMSLASYTNSMMYQIADPLNVRLDLTLQGSPFGQSGLYAPGQLNKLFISRAEVNYHPWNNTSIRFQYSQLPLGYYGLYSPYGSTPYFWGE